MISLRLLQQKGSKNVFMRPGKKNPCRNCDHQEPRTVISINTSKLYMEERSIHAGNVITKQLKRLVSVNTSE